jgi:hypothetical protein
LHSEHALTTFPPAFIQSDSSVNFRQKLSIQQHRFSDDVFIVTSEETFCLPFLNIGTRRAPSIRIRGGQNVEEYITAELTDYVEKAAFCVAPFKTRRSGFEGVMSQQTWIR